MKENFKNKIADYIDTKRKVSISYMYFCFSFCIQGILTEMYSA